MADSSPLFDVAVIGGGLIGPTLALALVQKGFSVALLDAAPPRARAAKGFDGRAYALAPAAARLLAGLGVWPALAAQAEPIRHVKACGGEAPGAGASPWFLDMDAAEMGNGPLGYMVEDGALFAALERALARAAKDGGRLRRWQGLAVTGQRSGAAEAEVTTATGLTLKARLLIGADGRESGMAARAGIARLSWPYDQSALVTTLAHEAPHGGTAYQIFLPEGPFALLPLPGGQRSSVVWSQPEAAAEAWRTAPEEALLAALRERAGVVLGRLSLSGPRFSYPLRFGLAESFTAPRLALVGDAAHGVHPLAGQGLNLGMRDVAALAEVLEKAALRGEDIGQADVLARYGQARYSETLSRALGMDALARAFRGQNPLAFALRRFGLGLAGQIGPLRRALMREAAGPQA